MQTSSASSLERTLSLPGAITLNLLDMIGVGPFITLPLLLGAMGGPQAMLGWVLGAVLALCDGLVWAELGAAMPEAGGTYTYLRGIFPGRWGRWLGFLFVFQLCISAPLSIASGCIGLAQYAAELLPKRADDRTTHTLQFSSYHVGIVMGMPTVVAIVACVLAVVLLYRNLVHVERLGRLLLLLVLGTIAWTVLTAVFHGQWARAVTFAPHAFVPTPAFFAGLGAATLVATYDFWGYYNVTFLGGEVRDPERTIPRALLSSIAIVTVLYLVLNASVLAVLGTPEVLALSAESSRGALLSSVMRAAYAGSAHPARAEHLALIAAVLVACTAFSSVFALLLGYSRVPYAAARDGNFFTAFGRLHPTRGFPNVSLLTLGAVACVFCCFSLRDVVAALVVLRILLQFGLQQVGLLVLRVRQPLLRRPFRVWLYPLPPVVALVGFAFVVFSRRFFGRELMFSAAVALLGSGAFLWWDKRHPHAG